MSRRPCRSSERPRESASPLHVLHVVGARPNFVKAAPVIRALGRYDGVRQTLVHTGQHYDPGMSDVFFRELALPRPDINLAVGAGTRARQTAEIMRRLEPVIREPRPDLALLYGDVNSTVAAALVLAKASIPIGHVEAGLRSFDRTMPEELNRIVTDQVADLLFTPSTDADGNLLREGVARDKIHFVGNVMIDSLVHLFPASVARRSRPAGDARRQRYGLVTLHRPSSVDDPRVFGQIVATLKAISEELPLIFPAHPRAGSQLKKTPGAIGGSGFRVVEPLGYLQFVAMEHAATLVITDSGGVQEETTYLGVPCLTVRESTERPITTTLGTNVLVGHDMDRLRLEVARILSGSVTPGRVPPLWDGRAAERIAAAIVGAYRDVLAGVPAQ